jgi:hypothetical protein
VERRSRTTLHGVSVRVALGLSLVVLSAACACSISSSDKAGGTARATTVLTMANGNFRPQELQLFADQVESLSAGSMRITFRNEWGSPRADYETQLIRDVDAGKADLGWVGTRAWDTVGVTSFDALHAPLLIDTYALQQKVLESTVPSEMLSGLGPLGIVGLGVLAAPCESHWAFQDRSSSLPSSKADDRHPELAHSGRRAACARCARYRRAGRGLDRRAGRHRAAAGLDLGQ